MEQVKEKKNKVEKELDKPNWVFYVRAIIFGILCISPAVFVFVRYKCYEITNKMSFSGYAILGLVLLVIGVWFFFRYIIFGGKWAYWKQVVKGIIKVGIPFGAMIGLVILSRNFLNDLLYLLIFSGICFLGAYLINPFPEWTYKKTLGETADLIEYSLNKYKNKNK